MKLTFKGDYSLKAVLELARSYGREPLSTQYLAGRIDAPVKFLEQVLLELKRSGIVTSKRGADGGYMLAASPENVSVGMVIRCIDGELEPIACVRDDYAGCIEKGGCVFRRVWQDVYQATAAIVDNVTFADLLQKEARGKSTLDYSI